MVITSYGLGNGVVKILYDLRNRVVKTVYDLGNGVVKILYDLGNGVVKTLYDLQNGVVKSNALELEAPPEYKEIEEKYAVVVLPTQEQGEAY